MFQIMFYDKFHKINFLLRKRITDDISDDLLLVCGMLWNTAIVIAIVSKIKQLLCLPFVSHNTLQCTDTFGQYFGNIFDRTVTQIIFSGIRFPDIISKRSFSTMVSHFVMFSGMAFSKITFFQHNLFNYCYNFRHDIIWQSIKMIGRFVVQQMLMIGFVEVMIFVYINLQVQNQLRDINNHM